MAWKNESERHQLASRGIRTPTRKEFKIAQKFVNLECELTKAGFKVTDYTISGNMIELKDIETEERKWYDINDLPKISRKRNLAFQISKEEYNKRRQRAWGTGIEATKTNKRKLAENNIWYTTKPHFGISTLYVLPEDVSKIKVINPSTHKIKVYPDQRI